MSLMAVLAWPQLGWSGNFMSLEEEEKEKEEEEVATVCAITQCVACLTYIHVAVAHTNTEDEDNYHEGCRMQVNPTTITSKKKDNKQDTYVHQTSSNNVI